VGPGCDNDRCGAPRPAGPFRCRTPRRRSRGARAPHRRSRQQRSRRRPGARRDRSAHLNVCPVVRPPVGAETGERGHKSHRGDTPVSRKFQPREGLVVQAYQFALDPTPEQADALRSDCGAARSAFNWGLAHVQANIGQRDAERSYDIPTDELTPALNWSAYSLRKDWNAAKDAVAPWWAENGKEAYSSGLANLADALGNWKASKTGNRAGPAMRFPRFKSK